MLAGGDFIKTEHRQDLPRRHLPVTLIMLEAVRDWRELTGEMVGVKPAGGIRTSKDAIKYLVMVNEVAGEDWLDPSGSASAPRACSTTCCCSARSCHRRLLRPRLRRRRLPRAAY
jgi:deoxyribose-phosphate aldolase